MDFRSDSFACNAYLLFFFNGLTKLFLFECHKLNSIFILFIHHYNAADES